MAGLWRVEFLTAACLSLSLGLELEPRALPFQGAEHAKGP